MWITLPFTLLFCLVKVCFHFLGLQGWTFDSLASALIAATTFVLAFVLGGTLSDYKYSEGLPAEICSAIEAIHDCNHLEGVSHVNYDPKPLLEALVHLLQSIHGWLLKSGNPHYVLQQITDLSSYFSDLERFSAPPLISRLQAEQAKLRQMVMRIHVIRETDFVLPAYAILEFFTLATVIALVFVESGNFLKDLLLSSFLFSAFVYLQLLIRDLDNPFDYNGKSSADISLAIIDLTLQRLQKSVAKL